MGDYDWTGLAILVVTFVAAFVGWWIVDKIQEVFRGK